MGKKIRLLALDLDGTLLNGAKQITPRTQAALERARQQGVLMVPVTGRPAQGLPPAVLSLPGLRYAVTSNGATIRDLVEQRVLLEKHLALPSACRWLARCAHIPMIRQVFRAGVGYLSRPDYETLRARYAGTAHAAVPPGYPAGPAGNGGGIPGGGCPPVEELFFLTDSPQTKQALRQCLADLPGIGFDDPFPNDLEVLPGRLTRERPCGISWTGWTLPLRRCWPWGMAAVIFPCSRPPASVWPWETPRKR